MYSLDQNMFTDILWLIFTEDLVTYIDFFVFDFRLAFAPSGLFHLKYSTKCFWKSKKVSQIGRD